MTLPLKIRKAKQADIPFILDSWLKYDYKEGTPQNKLLRRQVYNTEHRRLLESLRSEFIICCNTEDDDQIYGYLVGEKQKTISTIHYIYVKLMYQGFGIGDLLVKTFDPEGTIFITHISKKGEGFLKRLGIETVYNPYLLVT